MRRLYRKTGVRWVICGWAYRLNTSLIASLLQVKYAKAAIL